MSHFILFFCKGLLTFSGDIVELYFTRILKSNSHPPKNCFIYVNESLLKMVKNAFYFILKAFFVLKIFKFLSQLFGHVGKTA